jgi:hypothetical protein
MTTAYFFGYVDYNASTAQLSCIELRMMVDTAAARSFIADRFTSTNQIQNNEWEKTV